MGHRDGLGFKVGLAAENLGHYDGLNTNGPKQTTIFFFTRPNTQLTDRSPTQQNGLGLWVLGFENDMSPLGRIY